MAEEGLRYDIMVESALRGVVRDALLVAVESGLPGDHHFYITFRTEYPGVEIADYLRDRYATEMTIVIQYQFWDLAVFDDRFEVTLSFNDKPEPLRIPFAAVSAFADPSVRFGLQFDADSEDEDEDAEPPKEANEAMPSDRMKEAEGDGKAVLEEQQESENDSGDKIVALDSFRKK